MTKKLKSVSNDFKPYKASVTREQFLFHEMRTTAKLLIEGLSDGDILEKLIQGNLFQYPTEKSIKSIASCCLNRLHILNNESLLKEIAAAPSDISKQICLYAMMKQHRIVWDFMITVIGEKYRDMDYSFSKIDLNSFFMRLQEQDSKVALWSDSTIKKIKQVLTKLLVDNDYLDNSKSTKLNNVIISPNLEKAIREEHNEITLPAFGCF